MERFVIISIPNSIEFYEIQVMVFRSFRCKERALNFQYLKCGAETYQFEAKPLGKSCQLCKSATPIVTLTTQSLKLCKGCFLRIQERRVLEAVKKYKMFGDEDKVGIFLS
ncbi:MAG: hypothetical protein ABDI07_11745, partial [Candidatus Kryptonium sp.]